MRDFTVGRIWAGHNILNFDCPRIRKAFAEIGRDPPEPKGTIDSLVLLTQKSGRRDGDTKVRMINGHMLSDTAILFVCFDIQNPKAYYVLL